VFISALVRVRVFLLCLLVSAAVLAISACGGSSGSSTPPPLAPSLVSIAVTPAAPSVAAGLTQQFAATGTYSDGTKTDLTHSATWSSDAPNVATVSTSGLATSKIQGTANITATVGAIKGSTGFTVTAPTLVSLSINPANATIQIGTVAPQNFSAIELYTDQSTKDVTATSTWSVSNSWIASVDVNGEVSANRAGYTALTAVDGTLSASANVTVLATARYLYVASDAGRDLTRMSVNSSTGQPQFKGYQRTGNYTNIGDGCITSDPSGQRAYLSNVSVASGSFKGLVTIYSIDASSGKLAPRFNGPASFSDPIGCLVFEPGGKFAYAAVAIGNSTNALDTFAVNQDGSLSLTASVTLPETPGVPAMDPLGKYLYVATQYATVGETVHAYGYAIDSSTGALTPVDTDPFVLPSESAGSFSFHPSGKYLYLPDLNSATVTQYNLDRATGKISTANASVLSCSNASSLGFSPDGTHAYLACLGGNNRSGTDAPLIAFSIGATGTLTQIGTASAGLTPGQMVVDPSGKFIYLAGSGSDYISSGGSITSAENVVLVYTVASDGTVTLSRQIAGHFMSQAILLASGTQAVTTTSKHAYITTSGDNMLTSYNVAQDGTLSLLNATPSLAQAFSPANLSWGSDILLASPSTPANFTAYAINNGIPTQGFIFGMAKQTAGIVMDPSGLLAFGPDSSSGLVYEYANGNQPGVWSTLMTSPDNQTWQPLTYDAQAGAGPAITDPSGRFLIVANQTAKSISMFEYQGAAPIPPTPLTYTPVAIAMDPTGNWLFVAGDDQKLHLLLSNGLGLLTDSASASLPSNATSIAIDPSAHFVYTAGPGGLAAFSIDSHTLALNPIDLNPGVSLANASGVYIDPSGKFLYIPVSGSVNALYLFTINSDGTLTGAATNPVATPNHATGIVFDAVTQ
jgi:6-phosphogluconolactonase (cycloisomerase 2 family)